MMLALIIAGCVVLLIAVGWVSWRCGVLDIELPDFPDDCGGGGDCGGSDGGGCE